jgi:hypothetical protein
MPYDILNMIVSNVYSMNNLKNETKLITNDT